MKKMIFILVCIIGFSTSVCAKTKYWVCDVTLIGNKTDGGNKVGNALSYVFSTYSSVKKRKLQHSFAQEAEAEVPRRWEVKFNYSECNSYSDRHDAKDAFNRKRAKSKRKQRRLYLIDFSY